MLKAVQLSGSGSNYLLWTHIDPLGMSEAGDAKPTYDPLGNLIPWQPRPGGPPPNAYPPSAASYGGLGAGFGTSQSVACTSDRMPVNCDTALRQLNNGSASIDSIISNQLPPNFFATLGIALVTDVSTTRTRTEPPKPGRPLAPPKLWPQGPREHGPDPGPGGDGEGGPGPTYTDITTISYRLVSTGGDPQNTTNTKTDCQRFTDMVQDIANRNGNVRDFLDEMARTFTGADNSSISEMNAHANRGLRGLPGRVDFGPSNGPNGGFKEQFRDPSNQAR